MTRWCARHDVELRIADTRAEPPSLKALASLRAKGKAIEFIHGAFTPALLDGINLIAISPGLSPLEPALAAVLSEAQIRNISVWGELEFFAHAIADLRARGEATKILAITGTNGKTTTTALTGYLCKCAGERVVVAGNIGPTILDSLIQALDTQIFPSVWVLEVSSFQLTFAYSFAPDAAALLNLTQDHLDWHGDFEAYAAAKVRIFGEKTLRILARGDARVMAFFQPNMTYTFGLDTPENEGDFGCLTEHGMAWLTHIDKQTYQRAIPADALRIRGQHNIANALAALALCHTMGWSEDTLKMVYGGLREYAGEPHRFTWVASVRGIDFIDDSKATNVGATLAALQNAHAKRVVLILGGESKGQDFTPLVQPIAQVCQAVILIGRDAPLIRHALAHTGVPLFEKISLEAATRMAAALAQPAGAVWLSPACASQDMFRDYGHRAEVFCRAVEALAADEGVML
jgi:UDP-N-acetylmuramoylalanine--D-glutamate ligase